MTLAAPSVLAERIRTMMTLDPAAPLLQFDGTWYSWGQVAATAEAVAELVSTPGAPVGVVLRNSPVHVAYLLGVLLSDGCVVTINPSRGVERTRADVAGLDLVALLGNSADIDALATTVPGMTLGRSDLVGAPLAVTPATDGRRPPAPTPGVAVRMLTSGTTGTPKRIDLSADTVTRTMEGAKHYESGKSGPPTLRRGVAIVNSPLVHLGGLFRILQCVLDGRSFVLLAKFDVQKWAAAVREFRPKTVSLVPAALRMVLDSDLTREDLSSVLSVVSGTAPLAAEDADAFRERFGVPVLTSYAATEFGGGVAGWNLADFREFGDSKRGSVGRAHAGCGIRVVTEGGEVLPPGEEGLLEVKAAQLGAGAPWLRTTDLARIDADGFLWIIGRADQSIIRGGFKVQPEEVRWALELHPAVRGAVVFGVPDERLGAVPVGLVELRPGESLTPARLLKHAADRLARYELPARLVILEALPRTDSGKVDLATAKQLFAAAAAAVDADAAAETATEVRAAADLDKNGSEA